MALEYEVIRIDPSSHQETACVVQAVVTLSNGEKKVERLAIARNDWIKWEAAGELVAHIRDAMDEMARSVDTQQQVPDLVDTSVLDAYVGKTRQVP